MQYAEAVIKRRADEKKKLFPVPFGSYAPSVQMYSRGGVGVVYALVDPRDQSIRYVGSTMKSLDSCRRNHLRATWVGRKGAWIQELLDCGMAPEIRPIETVTRCSVCTGEKEQEWVNYLRGFDNVLLNDREVDCLIGITHKSELCEEHKNAGTKRQRRKFPVKLYNPLDD